MMIAKKKTSVHKEVTLEVLHKQNVSALRKYQQFFLEDTHIATLVKFELMTMFVSPLPGAVGLLFRKWLFPCLFKGVGSGVFWGRNISLRHPGRITIGDRVAIDDDCLLDAKGAGHEGIEIGSDVLIARGTIMQGKHAWIKVGNKSTIGSQCRLSSIAGIQIGASVLIAGQCFIGGGRYRFEDKNTPIAAQGLYSHGPVIIGDDVWLGAGVIVQDGVRIGKGCVVGSGAVLREDLPDYTVAVPHQRLVCLPRDSG